VTPDEVRAVALDLPGVTEAPHHGRPSYRLGTTVLATLWDEATLNVVLDESEARAREGGPCSLLWWGKRLCGVRVDLTDAAPDLVADLLEDAWRRRATSGVRRRPPTGPRRGRP
jgi:hypothetical protein